MIYVIIENVDAFIEGEFEVIKGLCSSLGYYTDANLAEQKVAELNKSKPNQYYFIPLICKDK